MYTTHTTTYQLEKYKGSNTRHTCPSCKKPYQFTRYVHRETGQYLSDTTGKCNRIDKCGYHYPPKQYFIDTPQHNTLHNLHTLHTPRTAAPSLGGAVKRYKRTNTELAKPSPCSVIPYGLFEKSLCRYSANHFATGLETLFGTALSHELIRHFKVGTAKFPANGTIFWQVDEQGNVRTGKIMTYHPSTLKRLKKETIPSEEGDRPKAGQPPVDWVHSRLLREKRANEFHLKQCLFGLHQLYGAPENTIGIVESEKTAIIATVFMQGFIWMATGGAQHLNPGLFQPLKGRRVVLFPDVNQYRYWQDKACDIALQTGIPIAVSDFMELNATQAMKENGADLADVLIKRDTATGLALTDSEYPVFWDKYPIMETPSANI